ncbi:MAG: hypothetical protein H8E79_08465 [Desulfobulbaceae bacterium]|uniref:Uncharacterized protein n=1 Tax=Candidatus Desulfatifera sulfidica TaxID=2841691 RepID=A0A8J6TA23_9BACT|nr:hypothetical protein [Candidatus Desulfatifera sulfidica]
MNRITFNFLPHLACTACLLLSSAPTAQANQWQDTVYDTTGFEIGGFVDTRAGFRLQDDANERDSSLGEIRLQLEADRDYDWGHISLKGDLLHDVVLKDSTAELREISLLLYPSDNMDLKIGRQTLTWGTGDLIFINDMFPKDWQAFFIGRDNEYLKAPSDAIKTSVFFDHYSLNLIYTPVFNPSTYVSGERLSYYNPATASLAGRNARITDEQPDSWFTDAEYALRLSRQLQGWELALYGYSGFWKEPEGVNPLSGNYLFPALSVYGASVRGTMGGGIANMEMGYYDSRDSDSGSNPNIRNSELRWLVGYEHEIGHELTGALQYYVEWMQDYSDYKSNLPAGMSRRDEYRHMLTLRLTKLLHNQNLIISLFAYYSPSDQDGHLRPKISYKISDNWLVDGGANIFWGEDESTFWGRFQDNTNIYAGLRYSF